MQTSGALLASWMPGLRLWRPPAHARAGQLGAVFRTVLETLRTLFVWLVDLLLFYTPLGIGKLGEAWGTYSYVQALGCAARLCSQPCDPCSHHMGGRVLCP